MKLSEEVKNKIIDEFNEWKNVQYGSKDKKERQNKRSIFYAA